MEEGANDPTHWVNLGIKVTHRGSDREKATVGGGGGCFSETIGSAKRCLRCILASMLSASLTLETYELNLQAPKKILGEQESYA